MELTLYGQSTVLIRMSEVSMLTDPWWGQFEFMRGVPIASNPELIEKLDLMLVSHNHIDHWSNPAIRLARKLGTTVVGSQKAVSRAEKHGLEDAVELKPGEEYEFGGIVINAVPAFHPFAKDAIGFVVEGEKTLYFSGDTRCTPELEEALGRFELDAALLQAACSNYPFIGKDGMDLDSAARLAGAIKPKLVIPIHYQVRGKVLEPEELKAWSAPVPVAVLDPGVPLHID